MTFLYEKIVKNLEKEVSGQIIRNLQGNKITTLGIGGPLDIFLEPINDQEVQSIIKFAASNNLPITPLGNGSNTLILDGGIRGITLSLKKLNTIEKVENNLNVGAGVSLPALSNKCIKYGLTGFEWASGIPATIGGAVVMNAGAFGGSMEQVVISVSGFDMEGTPFKYNRDFLQFNYRKSVLQDMKLVVTSVELGLKAQEPNIIRKTTKAISQKRTDSQPNGKYSAGSVFKISDTCNIGKHQTLKGKFLRLSTLPFGKDTLYREKLISHLDIIKESRNTRIDLENHNFNWITTNGQATAEDFLYHTNDIRSKLEKEFNINLDYEVRIAGETL